MKGCLRTIGIAVAVVAICAFVLGPRVSSSSSGAPRTIDGRNASIIVGGNFTGAVIATVISGVWACKPMVGYLSGAITVSPGGKFAGQWRAQTSDSASPAPFGATDHFAVPGTATSGQTWNLQPGVGASTQPNLSQYPASTRFDYHIEGESGNSGVFQTSGFSFDVRSDPTSSECTALRPSSSAGASPSAVPPAPGAVTPPPSPSSSPNSTVAFCTVPPPLGYVGPPVRGSCDNADAVQWCGPDANGGYTQCDLLPAVNDAATFPYGCTMFPSNQSDPSLCQATRGGLVHIKAGDVWRIRGSFDVASWGCRNNHANGTVSTLSALIVAMTGAGEGFRTDSTNAYDLTACVWPVFGEWHTDWKQWQFPAGTPEQDMRILCQAQVYFGGGLNGEPEARCGVIAELLQRDGTTVTPTPGQQAQGSASPSAQCIDNCAGVTLPPIIIVGGGQVQASGQASHTPWPWESIGLQPSASAVGSAQPSSSAGSSANPSASSSAQASANPSAEASAVASPPFVPPTGPGGQSSGIGPPIAGDECTPLIGLVGSVAIRDEPWDGTVGGLFSVIANRIGQLGSVFLNAIIWLWNRLVILLMPSNCLIAQLQAFMNALAHKPPFSIVGAVAGTIQTSLAAGHTSASFFGHLTVGGATLDLEAIFGRVLTMFQPLRSLIFAGICINLSLSLFLRLRSIFKPRQMTLGL